MSGQPGSRGGLSSSENRSRRRLPEERSNLHRRTSGHFPRFCRTPDIAVHIDRTSLYLSSCADHSGRRRTSVGFSKSHGIRLGQQGGKNKNPSVPKCSEGLRNSSGILYSSLAVFYVEQVALNRHVSPQPQLLHLS